MCYNKIINKKGLSGMGKGDVCHRIKLKMKKFEMKEMTDFEIANFEGFTLKKGFWYGRNLRGQAIATSTRVYTEYFPRGGTYGDVYIYTRSENWGWKGQWYDIDSPFFPDDFRGVIFENHKQNLAYQMPDDTLKGE